MLDFDPFAPIVTKPDFNPFKNNIAEREPNNDIEHSLHWTETLSDEVVLQNYLRLEDELSRVKSEFEFAKNAVLEKYKDNISVGTNTLEFDKLELKLVQREQYKIEVADNNQLNLVLQAIANDAEGGVEIASKLFKWKPELNKTVYDNLPFRLKEWLTPFLTLSLSKPTINLKIK